MEAVVYYRNRIRRLGYQPNVNGRNLASKKSNRIALIIPDLLKRERKDNITFRMIGVLSTVGQENLSLQEETV